jgi:hypothetical protein
VTDFLAILGVVFFAILLAGAVPAQGPVWHDEGNEECDYAGGASGPENCDRARL